MLVLIHAALRSGDKASFRGDAAVMLHALHNLPRAYMTKRAEYFTGGNMAVRPEEALGYADADIKRLKTAVDFERIAYSSADISSADNDGVVFRDGSVISFAECAENRRVLYPDSVSVAERDITAEPPYFDFYTGAVMTRISFDRKGFSAKKHNADDFHALCEKIKNAGYKTFDLS
jgi:hypothetical protein